MVTLYCELLAERHWNMWIPGFGSDEVRPYKRSATTEAHKQVTHFSYSSYCVLENLYPYYPTGAYEASPVLVSRSSRSAVASFSQLEADRKVTT